MRITEPHGPSGASEKQIQEIEDLVGARLPDDYRKFLAETNGGRPKPDVFAFNAIDGPNESGVDWFLTLDPNEDSYHIRKSMKIYDGRIPVGVIIIACDPLGNLILLDIGAKETGSVYFWDHEMEGMDEEMEDADEPTWDNISKISSSFTEFVNSLKES